MLSANIEYGVQAGKRLGDEKVCWKLWGAGGKCRDT